MMQKVWSLVILLFFIASLSHSEERKYTIFESKTGNPINIKELSSKVLDADVIFFGEFHDDSVIHALQKDLLTEMLKSGKKIAVSFEMFETDVQKVIDEYLAGKITEEAFLKDSRPWPDYKDFYKPLLELAKEYKMPVIAANVPRKFAAIYSNDGLKGIEKLPADDRKYIARNINVVEDDYKKNFYQVMIDNMGMDSGYVPKPNEENMLFLYYGAQVVKDETMGEQIADFISKNNGFKVIHFNGDFHSNHRLGTPQKVLARNDKLNIKIISPAYTKKSDTIKFDKEWLNQGDFIMAVEDKSKNQMSQQMMGGHLAENTVAKHNIKIRINTEEGSIAGSDNLTFKSPVLKKASVSILNDFKIESVTVDNKPIKYQIKADSNYQDIIFGGDGLEFSEVSLKYSGKVYHKPNERNLNQRHAYSLGMISSVKGEGIYLPGGSFYPATDNGLADFIVEIIVPKEFKIITSGKIEMNDTGDLATYKITTELPTDDLTVIGGRFNIIDSIFDGKRFSVYTIDNGSVTKAYLNAVIDYYKQYTKILGPYPFSGFAVVENFFATGFGMPGYTLLSNKLMVMPWITLTPGSLAHEFVHNWWGNSVFVDRNLGNWCEALTTFCSNFYYNVITNKKAEALDWRKKALLSLEALPEKNNYPLSKFKYQNTGDDAAIGYSKGGFLFYEYYKLLGDDRFFAALRNFAKKYQGKKASWSRISDAFDEVSKKDSLNIPIKKISSQWLMDTKIPTLGIKDVSYSNDTLNLTVTQDMMNYIQVPIRIITDKDTIWEKCIIAGASKKCSFKIPEKIKSVTVDPDYQVLRHLNQWEIPYSFSVALTSNPLLILPPKNNPDYAVSVKLAEMMKESDYKCDVKSVDDVKDEDWKDRPIMIFGTETSNPFYKNIKSLYPESIKLENENIVVNSQKTSIQGNIFMLNTTHPTAADKKKYMTLIYYKDIKDAEQFRRLFRYQSYSMVMLAAGKMGRPIAQSEIFPNVTDKTKLEYLFK